MACLPMRIGSLSAEHRTYKQHWQITIGGDEADLRILADTFSGEILSVMEHDGVYVMTSSELDELTEGRAVLDRAKELRAVLSSSLRLLHGAYRSLEITGITSRKEGEQLTYYLFPESGTFRMRIGSPKITASGEAEGKSPTSKLAKWVHASLSDHDVRKVLRLRDEDDLDWVALYRIYEVIEGDAGRDRILSRGWLSKTQITRLKHTANSVGAAGDQARHGKETTEPPRNPMSPKEARATIDRLVEKWVEEKVRLSANGQCP